MGTGGADGACVLGADEACVLGAALLALDLGVGAAVGAAVLFGHLPRSWQ